MRIPGIGYILASVLLITTAEAHPLAASLHPGETKRPAVPSMDSPMGRADFLEAMKLLVCVNALAAGKLYAGERACSEAIAINDRNPLAYKLRGYGYLLERRYERAMQDFVVALRFKPADAENLAGYAEALSGQGKFTQAVVQFTKAIRLAPNSPIYWNARCWARAGSGVHLEKALADCNRALALSADVPVVLNSRGLVRLRMGQYKGAIADYDRSLAARAVRPSASFGRGLALLRLGRKDAALADIASARKFDPDIDDLFVTMGVVPRDCARHRGRIGCPPPPVVPPQKNARPPVAMASAQP